MVIGLASIWIPVGVYVILYKYFNKSFDSNISQFIVHIIFCLLLSNRMNVMSYLLSDNPAFSEN